MKCSNLQSHTIFSSGMSRRADFLPALAADHHIGVDATELSSNAIAELAPALAKSKARLFVDSGAFGTFRANLRAAAKPKKRGVPRPAPKTIDFERTFAKYDELARALCNATDDGGDEAAWRVHYVMPDVVGDQDATLEVLRARIEDAGCYCAFANVIIPMQAGKYTLVEFFDKVCALYGRDDLTIGIPSMAAALADADVAELLEQRPSIMAVHILGAASEKTAAGRLDVLAAVGFDGDVSLDANRVRTYWVHPYCTRKEGLERLLAGLPPLRAAEARANALKEAA